MSDIIFRTMAALGSDVQVRSDGDQRVIEGLAVPYGVETRIDPRLVESFARGAFRNQVKDPARVPLFREHGPMGGTLIGKVLSLRDDASGLYFEARVSPTAAGDETLALVKDGVLDSVSIGFRTGQDKRLDNGTIERRSATLTELAVVGNPAYKSAKITGTRGACPTCGYCETSPDAASSLRAEVDAVLAEIRALPLPPVAVFRGQA